MNTIDKRGANIKAIDRGIKNRFSWAWLEEKNELGDFMSEYIRKIDKAGYVLYLV
jgi:chloramphenicol O-acetyltransferase